MFSKGDLWAYSRVTFANIHDLVLAAARAATWHEPHLLRGELIYPESFINSKSNSCPVAFAVAWKVEKSCLNCELARLSSASSDHWTTRDNPLQNE